MGGVGEGRVGEETLFEEEEEEGERGELNFGVQVSESRVEEREQEGAVREEGG